MRDHQPLLVEDFNGFFKRGDPEATPQDHFTDCNNIQFQKSAFRTRDGLDIYSAVPNPYRMYYYNSPIGEGLLVLNNVGQIYHVINPNPPFLVLTIAGMTDFGFTEVNQFAFISPSTNTGPSGMSNQFLYIYGGDQINQARFAAGVPPVNADGALAAANSGTAGNVEAGVHIFGVVYETNSGFLTQIGPDTLPIITAVGNKKVDLSNIPISPSNAVVARRIVATISIDPGVYNGNTQGYQFLFIPGARIADNTTTTLTVNFYDSDLILDASYLFNLFSKIPAGGGLGTYHGRLLSWDEYNNISLVRVSQSGQPEAINQISGLILLPQNGLGITNAQEYRDILYVFKVNKTTAFTDNGGLPSSWPSADIDQALGASKHGVCKVSEVGGISIEYLNIINYSGVYTFNGIFQKPELSFKINDFWIGNNQKPGIDQVTIGLLSEIYNDPLSKRIYITIPYLQMILMADYGNGLDFKDIRWSKWTFGVQPTTISLITKSNVLLIGSQSPAVFVSVPSAPASLSGVVA